MPIIPMRQHATIIKFDTQATDEWGTPLTGVSLSVRCRFQEGVKLFKSTTAHKDVRDVRGKEIVPTGRFFFHQFADITLHDRISYTNELGITNEYRPLVIKVIRGHSGKALATVVDVG